MVVSNLLLGASIGMSLFGGFTGARDAKKVGAYNAAAAVEDIKLVEIESVAKRGILREQGARTSASIVAAGGASGVSIASGSMLTAMTKQAEVNARNEFTLELETRFAQSRIRTASKLSGAQSSMQASGFRLQAVGSALSGAATIASMKD